MVTQEKFISNVVMCYRFGTILTWLGVLTWVPFSFLKTIGEQPSFLLFLAFHLLGVMSGAQSRSIARQELGLISNTRYPYPTDLVSSYATSNCATDRSETVGAVRFGNLLMFHQ